MKKLVDGLLEFREKLLPGYRDIFARLALGQKPDCLFVACSDSRVAANVFASTNPGDLFVIRNVGNMIPPSAADGLSSADESEAAAIEFALLTLGVSDIVVCGHSECGAMEAIYRGRSNVEAPNLRAWLRHGEAASERLVPAAKGHSPVNQLSQRNVLLQIEHLLSYPFVRQRVEAGTLGLHGWWFELQTADVRAFHPESGEFEVITALLAREILARSGKRAK